MRVLGCSEPSPGNEGGELAKKVMGLDNSEDLDDISAPGAMLRSLLGDLLIDYSTLSEMEQIGEGGFATVYKAELTHRNGMKQTVAVKCLRPERVQCDEDLQEFIAVLFPPHRAWLAAPCVVPAHHACGVLPLGST